MNGFTSSCQYLINNPLIIKEKKRTSVEAQKKRSKEWKKTIEEHKKNRRLEEEKKIETRKENQRIR
jgi:hypothetical protein